MSTKNQADLGKLDIRRGNGAKQVMNIFSQENLAMAMRAMPKVLAVIAAPGLVMFLVMTIVVNVLGIGSPMKTRSSDDGIAISCEQCPEQVSRMAHIEIGDRENALVSGHIDQGAVSILFRKGAIEKAIEVTPAMHPETVDLDGGTWNVQAVSTGKWNVGGIDISIVAEETEEKAEEKEPNDVSNSPSEKTEPVVMDSVPEQTPQNQVVIEFTDVQWEFAEKSTWDGKKVPQLTFSASVRNASESRVKGADMPILRVNEQEYTLSIEKHLLAGGLNAGESSKATLNATLDIEPPDNPHFVFASANGDMQLVGVDGLAEAMSNAYMEKLNAIREEQRLADEEKERIEAEKKQQDEAEKKQQDEAQNSRNVGANATPSPQSTPAVQGAEHAEVVYRTESGEKYHQDGCQYLRGRNAIPLTRDEAVRIGLEPCARCRP